MVTNRNFNYPKTANPGSVGTSFIATNPRETAPAVTFPSYNVYNKTESLYESVPPQVQSHTSGTEVGVYDSSTPQELLPVSVGTLEPTAQPVVVMNASDLEVLPVEEMEVINLGHEVKENPDWVVEIPSNVQPIESGGIENIKISFIDRNKPVEGVDEVYLHPPATGDTENIQISYLGNETSQNMAAGNLISLNPPAEEKEQQSIKISFEKEKENENVASSIAPPQQRIPVSHGQAISTQAPPMPTGPGVVNPFEGGIVSKIIKNATMETQKPSYENITVDFRAPGMLVPQSHVTTQQQREYNFKCSVCEINNLERDWPA